MDCRDAQALLSSLYDNEPITPDEREAAHGHCAQCDECAAFRAALVQLDDVPAPLAPEGLADRIVGEMDERIERGAVAASAAIAEAARPVSPLQPALEQPAWAPGWLDRRRLWTITASVAGVAATLSLVLLWGSGAFSMLGGPSQEELERQSLMAAAPSAESATKSADAGTEAAAVAAAATAPPFVAFRDRVYEVGGTIDTSPSALTTIGTVSSAFGESGAIVQATVYRPPVSDGSIVIASPGGLVECPPVQRTFDGKAYQLVAGAQLLRYGQWPRLPSTYPEPTTADGGPTFREAGEDASEVPVYTPAGVKPLSGFAIAPNTPAGDPARGNPYWTWWVPLANP